MAGDLTNPADTAPEQRALVDALLRSGEALAAAFADIDAPSLLQRPAAGEWSAWDIAYHVAQIEIWYYAKLCEAVYPDPVAAVRHFLAGWQELRVRAVALAEQLPTARLAQRGLLTGVPEWSAHDLLERVAAHDLEHAAQALAARATQGGQQQEVAGADDIEGR